MRRKYPNSKPFEIGCLNGYRLAFTQYSKGWDGYVADVILDPDHEVWELIYELSKEDLYSLDNYEGYPDVYTQFQVSIKTLIGIISYVLVFSIVCKNKFIPPAKEYMKIIKKTASEHRFPERYCAYLEQMETR